MSLEALRARSKPYVAGDRTRLWRGLAAPLVLVLALGTSSCQSDTAPELPLSPGYLLFTVQPPVYGTVGQPLSAPVEVSVVNASGRTLTDVSVVVTVTLGSNPANATLLGTTTVSTSEGVATFSGLSVDRLGTYTLEATGGGLPLAASAPFEVGRGWPGSAVRDVGEATPGTSPRR